MIYTLNGPLTEVDLVQQTAVIECAGVGYMFSATTKTLSEISQMLGKGQDVRVYTYMSVKEDGVELYGFHDKTELAVFRLLIKEVSGVGPKVALSVLSTLSPKMLAEAVQVQDAKMISSTPGIGLKTASRIVLELKDKIAKVMPEYTGAVSSSAASGTVPAAPENAGKLKDVRDALEVLGYSQAEINSAISGADLELSVEQLIKNALGKLLR